MKSSILTGSALAVLVAALQVSACQKRDEAYISAQPHDTRVAKLERNAARLDADAANDVERARQSARAAAQEAKQIGAATANAAPDEVADAVITSSVNGELAKDATLTAQRIDVDTSNGNVALKGSAPDAAARDRATRIAAGVKGVSTVENQLTLPASGP